MTPFEPEDNDDFIEIDYEYDLPETPQSGKRASAILGTSSSTEADEAVDEKVYEEEHYDDGEYDQEHDDDDQYE